MMERLTVKRKDGRWALANNDGSAPMEQMEKIPVAIDRLAAYEGTGLEPEEINELLHMSYGQLHKKLGDWITSDSEGRLKILPPNAPLTLEELREMDGEPVWIESLFNEDLSSWAIIDLCGDGFCSRFFYADFVYYGDEWLAYRRKPEEGI